MRATHGRARQAECTRSGVEALSASRGALGRHQPAEVEASGADEGRVPIPQTRVGGGRRPHRGGGCAAPSSTAASARSRAWRSAGPPRPRRPAAALARPLASRGRAGGGRRLGVVRCAGGAGPRGGHPGKPVRPSARRRAVRPAGPHPTVVRVAVTSMAAAPCAGRPRRPWSPRPSPARGRLGHNQAHRATTASSASSPTSRRRSSTCSGAARAPMWRCRVRAVSGPGGAGVAGRGAEPDRPDEEPRG